MQSLCSATPIPPGSYCDCVQWAGSLGPHGEWPTAIHSAYRSSLELYRHTIVWLTLETSSSGAQTPHTKCQFAAKLSALSSWFIELGPPFTILSSSGGISIACAMGRYLFKSFGGVKKERKGISAGLQSASFQQGHCEDSEWRDPCFFPSISKRRWTSNKFTWTCFRVFSKTSCLRIA